MCRINQLQTLVRTKALQRKWNFRAAHDDRLIWQSESYIAKTTFGQLDVACFDTFKYAPRDVLTLLWGGQIAGDTLLRESFLI